MGAPIEQLERSYLPGAALSPSPRCGAGQVFSVSGRSPRRAPGSLSVDSGAWQAGWTVDLAANDDTFPGGGPWAFGPGGFTAVGVSYQQALVNYLVAPASV